MKKTETIEPPPLAMVSPEAHDLLSQSLDVMRGEIKKLSELSQKSTYGLSPEDIQSLIGISKTLMQIDKHNKGKDPATNDDLSKLSDEELKALAKEVLESET